VFKDRRDAGRRLAPLVASLADEQPVVVGLPRGGVPVAREVADALCAPLGVVTVRKLGAPWNPELAIGAVAEDETVVLNEALLRAEGVTPAQLDRVLERERVELHRRVALYRGGRPKLEVTARTVIVVDDGLATGLTVLAAVRVLRRRGAARIVVAVPVGSREAVASLRMEADDVICHTLPELLYSVGAWYRDFSPTTDDEVVALLTRDHERRRPLRRNEA
jgi:putative phosphoribosyl transferase